jgi:hypothetical protein
MRTRDLKADRGLLPPKSLVTDKLRSLKKWRHWGRLRSLCHQYTAPARRAQFYYQLHRDEFLAHCHKRSNVETTFDMIKAKFRDRVRSKTEIAMAN